MINDDEDDDDKKMLTREENMFSPRYMCRNVHELSCKS